MTPEERQALTAELTDLTRKADKRRDQPGFAANVRAMDERIAVIEALLSAPEPEENPDASPVEP